MLAITQVPPAGEHTISQSVSFLRKYCPQPCAFAPVEMARAFAPVASARMARRMVALLGLKCMVVGKWIE